VQTTVMKLGFVMLDNINNNLTT